MPNIVYPDAVWARAQIDKAGFDLDKLTRVKTWLDDHAPEHGYRLVIVKDGYLTMEVHKNITPDTRFSIASAAKSVYGNVLGILVDEGALASPDAPVVDAYPEMMDVPDGEGPKENRYAFPENRTITYRQLISNTSGYMKPGEAPGKVFNYQTYGMNILTHAVATLFGWYDVNDPVGSPGFKQLIEEKLARHINVHWTYRLANFDLPPQARINIFGYYCQIHSNARDLARLGWLWCNYGRWKDKQVVPEAWMRESVRVNPDLIANCPEDEWKYGYGIWTNERGQLWPDFPRDAFTASGAGGHYISVFPSQGLVVVQNPGPYHKGIGSECGNPEMLKMILDAIQK